MPDTQGEPSTTPASGGGESFLARARRRGVLRVAASYAVIAWLLLQIADVVLEPLGAPKWAMTALIFAVALGFPVAVLLAWFYEIGDDGVHRDTAPAGAARPTVHGMRRYADVVVIGALLVTVGVLLVRQSDLGKPEPPANPAIAVLPFENLSGDPDQEYFSDGLAEEMLNRLGRVPGLKVIARSSSFGFKGQDADVRSIAEKLGVTTVLEGSVRRDGKRLRLSARLIDGVTGQQAWSGSYDRELNDIFAVQAELAAAIVEAIIPSARGNNATVEPPLTSDLDAYDLYLAARTQLNLRTPESIDKSVELGEQSVRLDPNFARGQAQLAAALLFQRLYAGERSPDQPHVLGNPTGGRDPAELLRRAESAIHAALARDPELSEAHGVYANLLRDTGRPGAEEQYARALELNPNNAVAWHDYAVYLGNVARRPVDSSRATARALELDPRQPTTWANYLGNLDNPRSDRFRSEFERALHTVGDMPFAVDRFTLPALSTPGFPVEVMKAAQVKRRSPNDSDLPVWINEVRAWLAVDLERAMRAIPDLAAARSNVDMEVVRLFLHADIAGLRGDFAVVDRDLEVLQARVGADNPRVRSVMAFWQAVQGRYDEAAASLALAEPVPEEWVPPVMGGDASYGLMETAQVRIYRATGREADARRRVDELLARLRTARRAVGDGCEWGLMPAAWMRYASLAANEDLKEEAVDALQGALRCGDLPPGFQPQLPWFRNLQGYPPYDALVRERERRVEDIKAELLRLEGSP
jgi:adenylate cyclase